MFSSNSSQPNKTSGQWHAKKGSMKESVGSATGMHSLQRSGREEHAAGQAEVDAAKTKGYVEGTGDRVTGRKDAVMGGIKGNKDQQLSGNVRQEKGERKQDWNHS